MLCDDIRQEARTNKYMLIGTYSGNIRVGAPLPVRCPLALYVELYVPAGTHHLELRISGPGKGSAILNAEIHHEEEGVGVIATPRLEIELEKEGYLRFDARISGGRWTNLLKKLVFYRPNDAEQLSGQSQPVALPT